MSLEILLCVYLCMSHSHTHTHTHTHTHKHARTHTRATGPLFVFFNSLLSFWQQTNITFACGRCGLTTGRFQCLDLHLLVQGHPWAFSLSKADETRRRWTPSITKLPLPRKVAQNQLIGSPQNWSDDQGELGHQRSWAEVKRYPYRHWYHIRRQQGN